MDEQTTVRVVGLLIGLTFIIVGGLMVKYPYQLQRWSGNVRRGNKHSPIPPKEDKPEIFGLGSYKSYYFPALSESHILATRVVGWASAAVGVATVIFVTFLLLA